MTLINYTHFDLVRAALGLEVDETVVSDDMIALPIYQGAAESEILRRDPSAATRTSAAGQHIINAAIYLTAALIAPAMTQLKRESFGDYSYAVTADWTKRAAELRSLCERELAAVLDANNTATYTRPTMFAAASALRGR